MAKYSEIRTKLEKEAKERQKSTRFGGGGNIATTAKTRDQLGKMVGVGGRTIDAATKEGALSTGGNVALSGQTRDRLGKTKGRNTSGNVAGSARTRDETCPYLLHDRWQCLGSLRLAVAR